ncbi:MAG: hypothetical protein M3Y13_07170 [Armatimonadota bacterium]|nr:hypothetical protein [Armatimonadota bacterium]
MLTKDEVTVELAEAHYSMDNGLRAIYRLLGDDEDDAQEPIKLLEINEDTIPAGIIPLYFRVRPTRNVFYSYVIVEIKPEEFEQLQQGRLELPDGWKPGELYTREAILKVAA